MWRARTNLEGHFCRVKHIRRKLAKKIVAIKAERNTKDRECQGSNADLKPEEPEESTVMTSSESQRLVGTHCVCSLV